MSKALSFAKLDYYTVKQYFSLRNLFLFIFIFAFIAVGTGSAPMVAGMLMMYGTIYASTPFAAGAQNGIDTLYATLPLKKIHVVTGRYLFSLGLNVVTGLIAFFLSFIIDTIDKKEFLVIESLGAILLMFMIFSIMGGIQLPIYFKFGYMKAKFLAYLPLLAFPVGVMITSAFLGQGSLIPALYQLFRWGESNLPLVILLGIVSWFILMGLSLWCSYRFYKTREF